MSDLCAGCGSPDVAGMTSYGDLWCSVQCRNVCDSSYYLSMRTPIYRAPNGKPHAEVCCIRNCPHDSQHAKTGCCIPEHWKSAKVPA